MIYELLSGGAALIGVGICAYAIKRDFVAEGYQDADGFHYGQEPLPVSTIAAPIATLREPVGIPPLGGIGLPSGFTGASADYTLTADQVTVLREMSEELGFTARTLAEATGLPEKRITIIRRELANMNLAFYGPLVDMDLGTPKGSGYLLTPDGGAVRNALPAAPGHVKAAG